VPARDLLLIPNLLSLTRILLAPVGFYLLSQAEPAFWPLLIIVAVVIASDFLDGFFARRLNQNTQLGLLLDPLGDKICLFAAALALLTAGRISWLFFGILLAKDLIIAGAGIFLIRKANIISASNQLGKWTTGFLACGIGLFALLESIAGPEMHDGVLVIAWVARIGLAVGVFLAILSLAGYAIQLSKNLSRQTPAPTPSASSKDSGNSTHLGPRRKALWLTAILAAAILCFLLLIQLPPESFIVHPWYWL
jgi:CDP-diacylglycerol--glycerol-3-phosphate 3-phosphatidyltransferase